MCNRLAKKYRGGCRYLASLTEGHADDPGAPCWLMRVFTCVYLRGQKTLSRRG